MKKRPFWGQQSFTKLAQGSSSHTSVVRGSFQIVSNTLNPLIIVLFQTSSEDKKSHHFKTVSDFLNFYPKFSEDQKKTSLIILKTSLILSILSPKLIEVQNEDSSLGPR